MQRRHAPSSEMRSSALWGRGGGGRHAHGIGKRGRLGGAGVLAALVLLVLPFVSAGAPAAAAGNPHAALMTAKLADAISEKPSARYDVIVTGRKGRTPGSMAAAVSAAADQHAGGRVRARYHVIDAMAATMSGAAIQALANNPAIAAITPDAPVRSTSTGPRSHQLWPDVAQVSSFSDSLSTEPTIAVVDSGVDATRADDFGARVVAQTSFVPSNRPNAEGTDGFGHGTFVASIAAGEAAGLRGRRAGREHRLARRARRHGRGPWKATCWRRRTGSTRTGRRTTSGSRTSRCWPARMPASCTTRSTRRSRSSGCPASWSYRSRQLRLGRPGQRRSLRPRERPVRDHGRRGRHQRHGRARTTTSTPPGRRTATRRTVS